MTLKYLPPALGCGFKGCREIGWIDSKDDMEFNRRSGQLRALKSPGCRLGPLCWCFGGSGILNVAYSRFGITYQTNPCDLIHIHVRGTELRCDECSDLLFKAVV